MSTGWPIFPFYKKLLVPVNAQGSPLSSVPSLDFLDLAKNGHLWTVTIYKPALSAG
jgi:hypothetical protein